MFGFWRTLLWSRWICENSRSGSIFEHLTVVGFYFFEKQLQSSSDFLKFYGGRIRKHNTIVVGFELIGYITDQLDPGTWAIQHFYLKALYSYLTSWARGPIYFFITNVKLFKGRSLFTQGGACLKCV